MVIFPYPKPTKCYGDTVIRRANAKLSACRNIAHYIK